jgi:hypothetical protein
MEENLFYLLGNFAGDGWFESRGIAIGTKNLERAKKLFSLMKLTFNKDPKFKKRIYKDGHSLYIVALYSVNIEKLFRNLLGNPLKNKSKNFKVPNFSDKSELRSFIRGLFEAEAYPYLWYNQPRIAFEIFNKQASEFIFNKLVEDGIKCYFSDISKGGYRIDITGINNTSKLYELYNVTFHRE